MVQQVLHWERQKKFSCCKCQGTMVEKCRFNIWIALFIYLLPSVTIVTRKEGKNKGRRSNMKKIPKLPFLNTYFKNKNTPLLVHGHFSWSTFGFLLVRGSKALKMHFLWRCDHGKRLSDMRQLHGPQCKHPLNDGVCEECWLTSFKNAFFGN